MGKCLLAGATVTRVSHVPFNQLLPGPHMTRSLAWPGSCWPDDPGPAVVRLHRILSRAMVGGLAIFLAFVAAALVAPGGRAAMVGLEIAVIAAGAWVVVRGFMRGLGMIEVLAILAVALGMLETPDVTGSAIHFAGYACFSLFVVAAAVAFRQGWCFGLLAFGLMCVLGVRLTSDHPISRFEVDNNIFPVMFAVAVGIFVRLLIGRAEQIDAAAAAAEAIERTNQQAQVQEVVEASVQRVLHDEVISALRAIHDLGQSNPEAVRAAANAAVAAVTALDEAASP